MKKKGLLIWVVVLAVALAACTGNKGGAEHIDEHELKDNYAAFENVQGKNIKLQGTCAMVSKKSDGLVIQIYLEPEMKQKPVYITYSGVQEIVQGQILEIEGELDRMMDSVFVNDAIEKAPHILSDSIVVLKPAT